MCTVSGWWNENKRVGDFKCIDAAGVHWLEKYASDGKRLSRTKVRTPIRCRAPMLGPNSTAVSTSMGHMQLKSMVALVG